MLNQREDETQRPLLSILVPTWNREKYLRELLAMLLPLVQATPRVELVISNNGSTDGTRDYLNSLPKHPRIRIIHQPVNYGMSLHLAWLYGQAQGHYLWLFSDDDLFDPQLLNEILTCLTDHPTLAWIHLPHQFTSPNGPTLSRCPDTAVFTAKGRNLFADYFHWFTLISSNVIRTNRLHPLLPKLKFESLFWPTNLLMAVAADLPACVLPYRRINAGPDISWADQRIEVCCLHLPETVLKSSVLSRAEKRACLREHYRISPALLDCVAWRKPLLFVRLVTLDITQLNLGRIGRLFHRAFSVMTRGRQSRSTAANQV